MAEARKAVASAPNDADGYVALAGALSFTGKSREALESVERAMRLNPHYPAYYLYQLGLAQFGLNRLDDAAQSLENALALNAEDYWSQRLLLSTYGLLGRREKAAKLPHVALQRSGPAERASSRARAAWPACAAQQVVSPPCLPGVRHLHSALSAPPDDLSRGTVPWP